LDVEKSTRAASKVLKEAYARLGTWVLATAAYNRGIGGIENAMKEQKAESFYDLRLNPQSQEFIYRVLAYKTLLSYPKHFDISFKPIKHYPKIPVKIVTLDTSMNYPENIARLTKSSVSVIMKINPWIVGNKLPNPERKEYKIKIPKFPERDYTPYYVELRPGYTDTPGSIRENKDSVVKPLLGEEMGSKFKQKAKK
jgi:Transglycosylase SLT domain.